MSTSKFRLISASEIYAEPILDLINRIRAVSGLEFKSHNAIFDALWDVNPELYINQYRKLFVPMRYLPHLFEEIDALMMITDKQD